MNFYRTFNIPTPIQLLFISYLTLFTIKINYYFIVFINLIYYLYIDLYTCIDYNKD